MTHQLKVGQEEKPFSFGFGALCKLEQQTGVSIQELPTKLAEKPLSLIIEILHIGFHEGARKEKDSFTQSKEDVADWLDSNPDLFNEAMKIINESMPKIGGEEKKE